MLFRRPHRMLKILSKMMTTTQIVPMTFFRKQNMHSSLSDAFPKDLTHLSLYLLLPGSLTTDTMDPVIDRLTCFKSIDSILLDLKSIGLFNDSNKRFDYFFRLLKLLYLSGKHEVVTDAFHHMVKSHGFIPNTLASNILIDSLFSTDQGLAAMRVYFKMNSPDSCTYNVILCHFCDIFDIPNLSAFLGLMLKKRYYPGDITFNKVLVAICKLNDYNDKIDVIPPAYQLLGLKVKLGMELSTNGWTSIIRKCCELGRLHDATNFFFDMIQTDCSSIVVPVTHAVLLKAFLESNKVDDALHLVNAMLSEGFKPDKDCFAKLVAALCADGRMDETVSIYRDIVMKHPHSDVHLDNQIPIMIMTKLINSGMNANAVTVFALANGSLKVREL